MWAEYQGNQAQCYYRIRVLVRLNPRKRHSIIVRRNGQAFSIIPRQTNSRPYTQSSGTPSKQAHTHRRSLPTPNLNAIPTHQSQVIHVRRGFSALIEFAKAYKQEEESWHPRRILLKVVYERITIEYTRKLIYKRILLWSWAFFSLVHLLSYRNPCLCLWYAEVVIAGVKYRLEAYSRLPLFPVLRCPVEAVAFGRVSIPRRKRIQRTKIWSILWAFFSLTLVSDVMKEE